MGIHRHILWDVEPSDAPKVTAVTWDRACDIAGELYGRMEGRPSVRLSIHVPDPVDAHGKHGVADGDAIVSRNVDGSITRMADGRMVTVGGTPLHQPEKRPATCACDIGAGAQPYAHEPSCPVHPRYVDTGLSDADRTAKDVPASHVDNAEPDGKKADLKAEYARALASAKAGYHLHGAINRMFELAEPLGYSPDKLYSDIFDE